MMERFSRFCEGSDDGGSGSIPAPSFGCLTRGPFPRRWRTSSSPMTSPSTARASRRSERTAKRCADPLPTAVDRPCLHVVRASRTRQRDREAIRDARGSYLMLSEAGDIVGDVPSAKLFPESDAPERWRYARSNGVALHADWSTACRRARWELAERDRVIRSWHGEIRPERLAIDVGTAPLGRAKSYDWRAYSFPEHDPLAFSRTASRW